MCAERKTAGMFALLLCLDNKFFNTFHKIQYFNRHFKMSSYPTKRSTTDHHQNVVSGEV